MNKRTLCILIVLLIVCMSIPIGAFADGDILKYKITISVPEIEAVNYGYDKPDIVPITITNLGSLEVEVQNVGLYGDINAFGLVAIVIIGNNGVETAGWGIQPVEGLRAGTYNAKVRAYYDDDEGNEVFAEAPVSFTVKPYCIITYMDSDNVYHTQEVTANTVPICVETPEKEGYVFDGWYTDEEYNEKYLFDSAITKNTILYAKCAHVIIRPEFENPVIARV